MSLKGDGRHSPNPSDCSGLRPSLNSGHTAMLRSAKISLRETSYVRKTLSKIAGDGIEKNIWYDVNNGQRRR